MRKTDNKYVHFPSINIPYPIKAKHKIRMYIVNLKKPLRLGAF